MKSHENQEASFDPSLHKNQQRAVVNLLTVSNNVLKTFSVDR